MSFFTESPLVLYAVIIGLVALAGLTLWRKYGKNLNFKEFQPKALSDTFQDELKRKFDMHGIKVKAWLYIGIKKVSRIEKYFYTKTKFDIQKYDIDKKEIYVSNDDKPQNKSFLFLKLKNPKWYWRLLGLKKQYYIVDIAKGNIAFDHIGKKLALPPHFDFYTYGDVWVSSKGGVEYLNDISFKRLSEQTQMHLENMPDKVVHLEIEQAKKERTGRINMELEKGKYEERKDAGDTTIL